MFTSMFWTWSAAGVGDRARDNGVEIIQLSDGEVERFEKAMQPAMDAFLTSAIAGELTGADVVAAMRGE